MSDYLKEQFIESFTSFQNASRYEKCAECGNKLAISNSYMVKNQDNTWTRICKTCYDKKNAVPISSNAHVTKFMDFSDALRMLKQGKRMARDGWNGKGMFIYLVEGHDVPAEKWTSHKGCITYTSVPGMSASHPVVKLNSHIDMKTADGSICVGWLASQTDMLAEDWVVVE